MIYFPQATSQVQQWVRSCPQCQRFARHDPPVAPSFNTWQHMNQCVGLDVIGPMKPDGSQRFIIAAVDLCTRFCLLSASSQANAASIIKLLEHWTTLFGNPTTIQTDNAPAFVGNQLSAWMTARGIHRRTIPAYRPQCNGTVERLNQEVIRRLQRLPTQGKWARHLPQVQALLNAHPNAITKLSAAQTAFGYQPRLHPIPEPPTSNTAPQSEAPHPTRHHDVLATRWTAIDQQIQHQHQRQQAHPDRSSNLPVGSSVLLFDHQHAHTHGNKLAPQWLGPYIIHKQFSPQLYYLFSSQSKKPFETQTPEQQARRRIMSEMWKRSSPEDQNMARQVFISPVIEAASIKRPTYNMMKDALTTWAKNHGGQVQYLRGLTSGDMLLQLDQNVMTYLRDNYFPEIDLHMLGCWQPKPSHQDTSVPSVVVEGVDRFLSHRAVVEKLKDPENATWLGVQPETLQTATLTFVRFHRKVDGSAPEPTSTGRLVGPPEIITRMAQKTGIYVGYPCYVREFAQQEKWKTSNRTMEVDSTNRGAKRNTEEREREEADEMITPSREAEQPPEPSISRRRMETPTPIDLTAEENQSTTEATPDKPNLGTTTDQTPRTSSPGATANTAHAEWLRSLSLPPHGGTQVTQKTAGHTEPSRNEHRTEARPGTSPTAPPAHNEEPRRQEAATIESENPFIALSEEIQQGLEDLSGWRQDHPPTTSQQHHDRPSPETQTPGPRRSERIRKQRERQEQEQKQQ